MKNRQLIKYVGVIIAICLLISGCAFPGQKQEITVAVYPYIPDMELFQSVLTQQWSEIEPDVTLKFVDWDCYVDRDPSGIDVIMYDALFTTYLAENGYIQPIHQDDLPDAETILPFAMEGAAVDGELYGIPYLVCSYFLMYPTEDTELAEVDNFSELYEVVMDREPDNRLMINYDIDYPYHYLDALIDYNGAYTTYAQIPDVKQPEQAPLDQLHRIRDMQTDEPELPEDVERDGFYRSKLFAEGNACCYYGYSEDMFFMGSLLDGLEIRTISFSETENIQLFFADIISLGSHVTDAEKIALCKKLMALVGSEAFQQELCFGEGPVQYMLPARIPLYAKAAQKYPMYGQLQEIVLDDRNGIFRCGAGIQDYLDLAYVYLQ